MPIVTASDGVRLHVRSAGSGTPLVFAHEFSGDARSWEPQIGFFSRYYRCTSYCARGYPPSDVPTDLAAYSQDRAAEDLADVVSAVGGGPAHVVGLSMGGFAALHFALRKPQQVRSLLIAGVGYGAKPEQQPEYAAQMRREAEEAEAIGMAAFARKLAGSAYAQCLRGKDETGWARFAAELAAHSATGMALTLRGVLATRPSLWRLADDLRRLALPVLLLIGDEDPPCLEPNVFLKSVLPDTALCVLPRSGHLVNLEEPTLFNTILFGFLAAVDGGRWSRWKSDPKQIRDASQGGSS
jgi:pimeloyl-ACP methyl ester carboxylesterase